MADNILFIIAGANGSGKTTISRDLLKEYDLEFLNADEMARELNPENLEKARIKAGKVLLQHLDTLILGRKSFSVETTLSGKYLIKKIEECRCAGYRVVLLYLFLDSPEIAINRIRARVKNGGHGIPDQDVIRRFHRSRDNFWKQYKNIVDEWVLYYNGEDVLVQVAAGWAGTCHIEDEKLFESFMKGL